MKLGIMQGRLSAAPKSGMFQFFPTDWRSEFAVATHLGFQAIEWIFDCHRKGVEDPFWSLNREDVEEISLLSETHEVSVDSICADYFMHENLNVPHPVAEPRLYYLIEQARQSGIGMIGIPFLEKNDLSNKDKKKHALALLRKAVPVLETHDVKIAIEADLPADELLEFVAMLGDRFGVCYDTGNATTKGFHLAKDIKILGKKIFEVHIKDRKVGSTQSVYLGGGDADLPGAFKALREIGFDGLCVMQAFRTANYLEEAARQLTTVRDLLAHSASNWILNNRD
jgi:L-ribulose-5-phosphate 3-epimerase